MEVIVISRLAVFSVKLAPLFFTCIRLFSHLLMRALYQYSGSRKRFILPSIHDC